MKSRLNNMRIVFSCAAIFCCMLTATFVFAQDKGVIAKKSYYVEKTVDNNYVEKNLDLKKSINKTVVNEYEGKTYTLSIKDGDVVATDNNNFNTVIYDKGDAKYLSEVNLYYYDTAYILIVTEQGELYANIYKSSDENVQFRKLDVNNIQKLKVIERETLYEYPSVELYGLDNNDKWGIIKL